MAIQLSSSYLRRSYQLLARLSPTEMTDEAAFERASNIIYEWAKRKFAKIFRQMPYAKTSLDDKRDGNEIGIIYNPKTKYFVFRAAHPDVSVPGRMWIVDTQLHKSENEYIFSVRVSVTSLQSCTEDVPFSCPQFVQLIIEHVGISDIINISNQPHLLLSKKDVDDFLLLLENSKRQLPAIILTPCYQSDASVSDGYMMDATQMAKTLSGVAHVFIISAEANEYLTESVGQQWSAFNGAVRTYYPNLSFAESDPYRHPLVTQQRIRLRNAIGSDVSNYCMSEIVEYIQTFTLARHILWEDQGIKFYLKSYQEYLQQQYSGKQGSDELIASYKAQIDQLQKQCDENIALADSYAKDYEICADENNQQQQLIRNLKAQIAILRDSLKNSSEEYADEQIPEDGTYLDIGDWINRYYPDKLFLHARAARSLKSAIYSDPVLVYKCLKLLATSYYDYCIGLKTYEAFLEDCKHVDSGLEESGAITDTAAGMYGDTYFVIYQGKKRKLDRHLGKGSNKDRRYCLRIYYFWDEENQTIVIGDMPHHLDTSAT